jgi:4-amino-4-deoxy-L-arabinose transferase-like glycosyltransferase
VGRKEISIEIKRPEAVLLLLFLLFILGLELSITFDSPIAFGDEAGHTYWAKYIGEHVEIPIAFPLYGGHLMGGLKFNRPPLWNVLEASFYLIFGFHEVIVKFLTPFIAFLTALAVYLVVKRIYSRNVALLASIIAITIPSYVTYSVLFYVDVLFVFYFSLGVLLAILALRDANMRHWVLAIVFLALSVMTKIPGYIVFPLLGAFFLTGLMQRKSISQLMKWYGLAALIMAVLLLPEWTRTFYHYGFVGPLRTRGEAKPYAYKATHSFERRMMPGEVTLLEHGLTGYARFAYGNLWFVPLTFIAGLLTLWWRRDEVDRLLLIALLLFVVIFYRTYQGRTEDMARYLLASTPLVATTSAVYLEGLASWLKGYSKHLVYLLILVTIVAAYLNSSEKLEIMRRVKQFSPSFFQACEWVRGNLPVNATLLSLWGHQTVYHCQRSAVWDMPELPDIILGQDLNLTLARFELHGITHIFLPKFSIIRERFSQGYWTGFVRFLEQHPDTFVKAYENGPDVTACLMQGRCDGVKIYEVRI